MFKEAIDFVSSKWLFHYSKIPLSERFCLPINSDKWTSLSLYIYVCIYMYIYIKRKNTRRWNSHCNSVSGMEETKKGPGKRRKAGFPRPWVGRWTRCSRVRLRHALANSQGSAFSFLRGRKEREKEKQKREMRAEIAATGVAHYANKSTSVHLLVEAGSNRAGAVDE